MLDLVFARVKGGQCEKTTRGCMPRIQGWVGREERYVHFMNACWKTNHKNCAHGDGDGKGGKLLRKEVADGEAKEIWHRDVAGVAWGVAPSLRINGLLPPR